MSYHKIIIVGHLGKDPEMRYTPSGTSVTSFSVATDRKYTDREGKVVKETCWFRVTVWGKQAEACNEYLTKGSLVVVEGSLKCDPATGGPPVWTSQKTGKEVASFEINASHVSFESGGRPKSDVASSEEEF
jgi:single-strand DNA-binding protein